MSTKLMDYFNKQPRLGTLSTSGRDGKVNVAYFGSPRMVDEEVGLSKAQRNSLFFENCTEKLFHFIPGLFVGLRVIGHWHIKFLS